MTPGGSGPFDDALAEVEVEEAESLAAVPRAGARPGGAGWTRGGRGARSARGAVLGVGAVVLVTALVATGMEVAAERDRQVRLAGVAGVTAGTDLTQRLEERWRVEARADWVVPGATGLVLADTETGVLRGIDQRGERLWEVPLGQGSSCIPLADPEEFVGILGYLSLASVLDRPVATVVCEEPGDGLGAWSSADGSRTGRLEYDGEVRTVAFLGTDLLTVTDDADGGHRVRRWSPGTGEVHWQAPAPPPRRGLPWLAWDVAVLDGTVLVRGTDTVRLDAETGATSGSTAGSSAEVALERGLLDRSLVRVRVLPDGTEVVMQNRRADLPGTVLRRPGGVTQELDGQVLFPVLSDQRDSGELFVASSDSRGSSLQAYDVASGRPTWRTDGTGSRSVLLELEDRLLVLGDDGVLALDRRSGERLWSAPRAPDLALAPVTDGDVVLLTEVGTRAGNDLVARRLVDGAELWRAPLPSSTVEVGAVDGVVLVRTADAVVALG